MASGAAAACCSVLMERPTKGPGPSRLAFADPQQRQPELQVGGVAYRCPIEFRHQVARLEPGTLGRRLRVDLEDDCSARPNPFWTLVPRLRPSHPQPRPAAPSWPRARLPCAPLPAVGRAVPRSPPAPPEPAARDPRPPADAPRLACGWRRRDRYQVACADRTPPFLPRTGTPARSNAAGTMPHPPRRAPAPRPGRHDPGSPRRLAPMR